MRYKELEQFKKDTIEGLSIPSYMSLEFKIRVKGITNLPANFDENFSLEKCIIILKVNHSLLPEKTCMSLARLLIGIGETSKLQEEIDKLKQEADKVIKRCKVYDDEENEGIKVKEYLNSTGFKVLEIHFDTKILIIDNGKDIYRGIYSIDENGKVNVEVHSQIFEPAVPHFLLID